MLGPFLTFMDRLDGFEGRSQLRTWLFGILHRKVKERPRAYLIDDRADAIEDA